MRLMIVNIFFDPESFGGATVVAEQMGAALQADHGFEVTAVSARFSPLPATSIVRHRTKYGFDAWSLGFSPAPSLDSANRLANPDFDAAFEQILDYERPDVVHVHCVQEIGASFFDLLVKRRIPFAVTVHDFWWICERQFMVTPSGEYCGQRTIDYRICAQCTGSRARTERRAAYLKGQLAKADMIMTPSEFARGMLLDNGFAADQVKVNKNGIPLPGPAYRPPSERERNSVIKVGFVGGPGTIKGWDLITCALSQMPHDRIRIVAFDAGARIGSSWRFDLELNSAGLPIEIVPGYGPGEIDAAFGELDAIICPSRWKETFGLTVREAIIRGIWAIASDAGGLGEDIIDGENGRVLPFPPTAGDVRNALTELLAHKTPPVFEAGHISTADDQAADLAGKLNEIVRRRTPVDRVREKETT